MAILYHIVPKDSGYFIVGKNQEGIECLLHKAQPIGENIELVFYSEDDAKHYLENNLTLEGEYKVEEFWRSDAFICPNCGGALEVDRINRLGDSEVEYACVCRNKSCGANWLIVVDKRRIS